MLTCAVLAAACVASLMAVSTAQAQDASPVRVDRRTPGHPARPGSPGEGNDSWDANAHGYRNC
ncbi:MAG TPA: hypothetical protein VES02_01585 [Dermatophilaceae bacterium]|nr:hypothetical protein [Dermatophilaceae bacterium]